MTDTAHERYAQQVSGGDWRPYNDLQAESQRQQIAGVIAERDALAAALAAKAEQVAGLVAERDALRVQVASLQAELADACNTLDRWRRAYYGDGGADDIVLRAVLTLAPNLGALEATRGYRSHEAL